MTVTMPVLSDTAYSLLVQRAQEGPDTTCVSFTDGLTHTRSQILACTDVAAGIFTRRGVEAGDRIALMADNRVEFLYAFFAAAKIGAVLVPINTALTGRSLAHVLDLTQPVLAVVSGDYSSRVAGASVEPLDVVSLDDLRFEDQADPSTTVAGSSLPALIMFTSGTTGASKGVAWTQLTGLYDSYLSCEVLEYTSSDVVYTTLPLFHINALFTSFVAGLMAGAPVVISPRFSASQFWTEVRAWSATTTSLLGSMATILWRQAVVPQELENTLRVALVVPAPQGFYQDFERRFGLRLTQVYGSTDMSIPLGVPAGERMPSSCGKVLPGWECQIVDESDMPVPPGETGELAVRPQHPFIGQLGYWGMPEETVRAWTNLWFHTGDLFRYDAQGWFFYVGRRTDAIRKGGENVSAYEVELTMLAYSGIDEVAVIGVPSDLAEEEVAAIVVPAADTDLDPGHLRLFLEENLPFFAVPRYLALVEALPKTETQKVRKDALRQEHTAEQMLDLGPTRSSRLR